MYRKLILIAMTILFFWGNMIPAVAAPLTQVEFDIEGIKTGDELTEDFFNKYCPAKFKDSKSIECKKKIKLNDVKLSVRYFFYDAKLLAISFNYPSSEYALLVNFYEKMFSKKPVSYEETATVSTGDTFINKKSSWNTKSGKFVIEQYSTSLKKGLAYQKSHEYEQYATKKREEVDIGIIDKVLGYFIN